MLSVADIAKFQQIYREEFGIDISSEEAAEQGRKLLTLLSLTYHPMTQSEYDETMSARKETIESMLDGVRV